ncbi:hypothetical protein [Bacillus sp. EB600]|nr:hypothetical protein [Bacillus sp. EB600]MCQ6281065.1 hypothetical protein [Bacillus sp. EB600]
MQTISDQDIRKAVEAIQTAGMREFLVEEPIAMSPGPLSKRSGRLGRSS